MHKMLPLAAFVLALAGAAPAFAEEGEASCGNSPREQWLSEDAIKAKGLALGYDVGSVKVEGGCYELQATDKAKVKLYLHPVTGEVVKLEDRD